MELPSIALRIGWPTRQNDNPRKEESAASRLASPIHWIEQGNKGLPYLGDEEVHLVLAAAVQREFDRAWAKLLRVEAKSAPSNVSPTLTGAETSILKILQNKTTFVFIAEIEDKSELSEGTIKKYVKRLCAVGLAEKGKNGKGVSATEAGRRYPVTLTPD